MFIVTISLLIGVNLTLAIVKALLNGKKACRKRRLEKHRIKVEHIKMERHARWLARLAIPRAEASTQYQKKDFKNNTWWN